jgi:hypothetical protein
MGVFLGIRHFHFSPMIKIANIFHMQKKIKKKNKNKNKKNLPYRPQCAPARLRI